MSVGSGWKFNSFPPLRALGDVLEWTVTSIQVTSSNEGGTVSRVLRSSVRTLVSFVAFDDEEVVPSEDVRR